jgi:acetylornithine deacetylase/succinyl-diaminopimelate desuccinylase-like protein
MPTGARPAGTRPRRRPGWPARPTRLQAAFGRPAAWIGEGGTIPFMNMLGGKFPNAQFLITGVLGPKSNAHGPNEFLHIDCVKKLSVAVASIVAQVPA